MPEHSTRQVEIIADAESVAESNDAFRRSLAVIIGINDYANGIPRLETPVNDAERIAAILERDQNFVVQEKLTADVTRAKLAILFTKTLPALQLDKQDRLLVYFAGHGVSMQGDDGEPEYFLVPQDARAADRDSFLPMRDIREWLLQLDCRHLLFVLDCCFAGGFGRMRVIDTPPPVIYRQRYNFYVRSAAWQVIASAAHDETALDTAGGFVFGRRYTGAVPDNSPFALALIDALSGQADMNPPTHPGEPNGDGLITVTEVLSFVRDRVQAQADEISHRQTPALWSLLPKHQAGEYFFGNPQRALQLQDAPALTTGTNPYRGLSSYDEQQSELFFGRSKQIQQLSELAAQHSFLAVLGASGTGKSSLVKAGLVPTLINAHVMRPTNEPLPALEKLLGEQFPEGRAHAANFAQDENALVAFVAAWRAKNAGQRLVLVIDQFEELVTLCDESERKQFQTLLANALRQHADVLCVILTLRTDFEPSLANGPLQEFWRAEGARYIVPPMTQDDLRQVIVGPALKREVYFESAALVETLINEVIQTPGGLPLLSFTLSEMYVQYLQSGCQDRTLSEAEYRAVGGVIGSLRNAANKVYKELEDDHHRSMMERVMLRMVAIEGGEVARRRVSTSELDYGAQENPIRQDVVDTLTNARLVVNGGEKNTTWTEPAHDALISGWDRLMEWKLRAAPYLPLQRELAPAALRWQAADAKQKTALLWNNDPRLSQLQDTLWHLNGKAKQNKSAATDTVSPDKASPQKTRASQGGFLRPVRQLLFPRTDTPTNPHWLNQPEIAFVRTSIKQRSRVFRQIIGITAAVIVALSGLTAYAFYQQAQAEQRAIVSQSKTLAAQSVSARTQELLLSYLLGVEAFKKNDNAETRSNLFELYYRDLPPTIYLRGHTSAVSSVAFSPDGKLLASGSCRELDPQGLCQVGEIFLWDMESNQRIGELEGNLGPISSLAFSPDGRLLACGDDEGNLSLWDMTTKKSIGTWKGHLSTVYRVVFSPDGKTLISGSFDGKLIVWNIATRQPLAETKGESIGDVALSPDGKMLASVGTDIKVRLWDISIPDDLSKVTLTQIAELEGHTGAVVAVAFSPDGKKLASGTSEILVWDVPTVIDPKVSTKKPVARLAEYEGAVHSLAFSLDGKNLMAAGDQDTLIRLWDLETNQQVGAFQGHTGPVNALTLSRDGKTLASGGKDKEILLWNAGTGRISEQKTDRTFFEPDNPVLRWKVGSGQARGELFGNDLFVQTVAFSPDGKQLLTTTGSNTILWDVSDPRNRTGTRQTTSADWVIQNPNGIPSIAFSPDSRTFALANVTDPIQLWDIPTRQLAGELEHNGEYVQSVAFSNDGKMIVAGGCDLFDCQAADSKGIILLWNATTKQPIGELDGHTKSVGTVAFSPQGALLAADSPEGIMLWDLGTRQMIGTIKGHSPFVFDSAGKILASSGDDNAIWLWDVETRQLVGKLKGHAAPLSSLAFSSDGKTLSSGSCRRVTTQLCSPGEILLWDMATQQRIGTLNGHADTVLSAAFSPDGKLLASSSADNRILLWDVDVQSWVDNACKIVNRNMTRSEYAQYINRDPKAYDTEYAEPKENRTCPDLPVEPVPTPIPTPTP